MVVKLVTIVVPIVLIAIPCVLCGWIWWTMRKRGSKQDSPHRNRNVQTQKESKPSPFSLNEGEVALTFRIGGKYYNPSKSRVMECVDIKGKRARLVSFASLDEVESWLSFIKQNPELAGYNKVRVENGVETCMRGAYRADRIATPRQVDEELAFLRDYRNRVACR